MMSRREMFAGAPIFRGRWAAIVWLWISGALAGDMDIGFVWLFTAEKPTTHTHWGIDAVMGLLSAAALIAGIMSLDQYGRNAWLAWAPDDEQWSGLTRGDVNRAPMFRMRS